MFSCNEPKSASVTLRRSQILIYTHLPLRDLRGLSTAQRAEPACTQIWRRRPFLLPGNRDRSPHTFTSFGLCGTMDDLPRSALTTSSSLSPHCPSLKSASIQSVGSTRWSSSCDDRFLAPIMTLTPAQWVALGAGIYAGIGLPLAFVWWYRRRYRLHRPLPIHPDEVDAAELLDQTVTPGPSTPYSSAAQSLGLRQVNPYNRAVISPSPPSTASFTAPTATTRESSSTAHSDWPQSLRDSRVLTRPPDARTSKHVGPSRVRETHVRDSLSTLNMSAGRSTDRYSTDTGRTARHSHVMSDAGPGADYRSSRDSRLATDRHASYNSVRDVRLTGSSLPPFAADGPHAEGSRGTFGYAQLNSYVTEDGGGSPHSFLPGDDKTFSVGQRDSQSWRYPQNWPVSTEHSTSPEPATTSPPSAYRPPSSLRAPSTTPPLTMPVPMPASPPPAVIVPMSNPSPTPPEPEEASRPPSQLRDEIKRQLYAPTTPAPPKSPGAVTILKDVLFSEPEQMDACPGPSRERVIVRNEEDAETVRLELLPPQYRPEWAEGHAPEAEKVGYEEGRCT